MAAERVAVPAAPFLLEPDSAVAQDSLTTPSAFFFVSAVSEEAALTDAVPASAARPAAVSVLATLRVPAEPLAAFLPVALTVTVLARSTAPLETPRFPVAVIEVALLSVAEDCPPFFPEVVTVAEKLSRVTLPLSAPFFPVEETALVALSVPAEPDTPFRAGAVRVLPQERVAVPLAAFAPVAVIDVAHVTSAVPYLSFVEATVGTHRRSGSASCVYRR